ncbi:MAG: cupredoxin domain-containing protein [Chitinophagales bacterium]
MSTIKMKAVVAIGLGLLLIILLNITGCKKETEKPPANEVWIQDDAFNPEVITVSANSTVVWRNKDDGPHTVTSDTTIWDSGNIQAGASYSRQFPTAGTYHYHCNIHNFMKGTVIVQ